MSEQNITKSNRRIAVFDYLKALAILLVIINHYVHTSWPSFRGNIIFPTIIKMPVPIFMIVSGCMLSMSYNKRFDRFIDMYKPKELSARILRFWITFFFEYIVEVFFSIILLGYTLKPVTLIRDFLVGGPGANGSYYVPVLIQLVLVFPLIFTLIRKFNSKGLLLCIVINFAYEAVCTATDISAELYRLLMPRYITYVALGCWFYFNNYKITIKKCIIMFVFGLGFILMLELGYKPFVFKKWTDTCMVVALYIFPIIALIISRYKNVSLNGRISAFIQTIGNASYHIFLVQMLYYNVFNQYIIKIINIPIINLPFNIVICTLTGILFYNIEKGINARIIRSI